MIRTAKTPTYEPDYAVPPGETLQETIAALGMGQKELSTRMGMSEKHISQIMNGIAPITYETADKLELVTGVPARTWNNLEMKYRERLAKLKAAKRIEGDLEWLGRVPTKELVARGKVPSHANGTELLRAVLAFFGVSSVDAWNALWRRPAAACRWPRCFELQPEATATWLRLGDLEARMIPCKLFDKAKFRAALDRLRMLTVTGPEAFRAKMVALCAEAGVAVVFVQEIKGCTISGAARWLTPDKAVIQLGLRHNTDDHLWLSFLHQAGHVLHGPKKNVHIDDGTAAEAERDKQADRFACRFLPRRKVG